MEPASYAPRRAVLYLALRSSSARASILAGYTLCRSMYPSRRYHSFNADVTSRIVRASFGLEATSLPRSIPRRRAATPGATPATDQPNREMIA